MTEEMQGAKLQGSALFLAQYLELSQQGLQDPAGSATVCEARARQGL